jgi:hypothetical protein
MAKKLKAKPKPKPKSKFRHSLANMTKDEERQGVLEVEGEPLREPEKPKPSPVVRGYIAMHLVNYRAHKSKSRDLLVTMNFSLELVPELKGFLPKEIEGAWQELVAEGYVGIQPPPSEEQNLEFYLAPDYTGNPDLKTSAEVESAYIEAVEKRGEGKKKIVTRLTLWFTTDLTDSVDLFCRSALDEVVYAKMETAQRSLTDAASA